MNLAESKCQESVNCGDLGSLAFPLSNQPGCGGTWYKILQKMSTNKFRIVDEFLNAHLRARNCVAFRNSSLPVSPFSSFRIFTPTLTIFSCSNFVDPDDKQKIQDYFEHYSVYTLCDVFTLYYGNQDYNFPNKKWTSKEKIFLIGMCLPSF
ncbi:hypothetical protein CDL12_29135 [Handroanthus impetiginosus]|uniref:Uncharacterized protein n=1 Tax=Handroanthus impetiginosus TaxID=429701 RepID=A0A2G9FZ91_9LAMI|nr:hypothetical protein CDL12_29135 [Handroanthus impetiginosus]